MASSNLPSFSWTMPRLKTRSFAFGSRLRACVELGDRLAVGARLVEVLGALEVLLRLELLLRLRLGRGRFGRERRRRRAAVSGGRRRRALLGQRRQGHSDGEDAPGRCADNASSAGKNSRFPQSLGCRSARCKPDAPAPALMRRDGKKRSSSWVSRWCSRLPVCWSRRRDARADDATVTVGTGRFAEPPEDQSHPPQRERAARARGASLRQTILASCTGRRSVSSSDRRASPPARASASASGVGADFGTGSVGGRLAASWLRGEGHELQRHAAPPPATSIGIYSGEVTLDLHKRGPVHPVVGMGVGLLHVSRARRERRRPASAPAASVSSTRSASTTRTSASARASPAGSSGRSTAT